MNRLVEWLLYLCAALILEEIAIDSHDKAQEDKFLAEAQELHLQSLELAKKAFGENNVQTAKHYGNLGRLYQSMHRFRVRWRCGDLPLNKQSSHLQRLYQSMHCFRGSRHFCDLPLNKHSSHLQIKALPVHAHQRLFVLLQHCHCFAFYNLKTVLNPFWTTPACASVHCWTTPASQNTWKKWVVLLNVP